MSEPIGEMTDTTPQTHSQHSYKNSLPEQPSVSSLPDLHTSSTPSESSPRLTEELELVSDRAVPGSAYLALPRAPSTWLLDPLLPVGGSILLYGDPKVGKSYAALQMCFALATGRDFLGFAPGSSHSTHRSLRPLYIQLDTARTLWADRIDALGRQGAPIDSVLFADRDTLQTWPFNILDLSHATLLQEVIQFYQPDVVIMDTLRECHTADENDSTSMKAVISQLEAVVKPAALVLVAHAKKAVADATPNLINDSRGSSYIVGKVDGIIRFSHTSMRVSGRAIDEQSISLTRRDDGMWDLAVDPLAIPAAELLASDLPLREAARILAAKVGKSESACRAYLRRRQHR